MSDSHRRHGRDALKTVARGVLAAATPGWRGLLALTALIGGSISPLDAQQSAPVPGTASGLRPEPHDPQPILPPQEAFQRGWLPLSATRVDDLRKEHPAWDGRGVLIGILDSGIDAGIPGLTTTSTGDPKILDLRDFSDEGAIALTRARPGGDSIAVGGHALRGFSRVAALNANGPWFVGTIRELPLGEPPAADLNGDGDVDDTLPVVVTHASDGWVLFADTDGDGSLANERPVHDYLALRETFGWAARGRQAPLTVAVNFAEPPSPGRSDDKAPPLVDLYFDTSGHGSHVAGIAAGHDLYGVSGFDGVAPGAQLLGLKIANNAQGGLSVTGSMVRAIDYAIRFAESRRLPLVLNLSFGVGNEVEGQARIDALVDSILTGHPDVVFTLSAGNDGPGLSTLGFPGSATRVITVGATFPGAFLPRSGTPAPDPVAFFSSRGGELAKPDLVAPGIAYSTVPRWNIGDERKGGTSMAAPHAAGLAAILLSSLGAGKPRPPARVIKQALMVTAQPVAGETFLDVGTGVPNVAAAARWLGGMRSVPDIEVRAAGNGVTAAYRGAGLASDADTVQEFVLSLRSGGPQTFSLRSGAPWISAPPSVVLTGSTAAVKLSYRAGALRTPGVYTGVVSGWTSDTMAGPVFRLVNTVVVPGEPDASIAPAIIDAGGQRRLFFQADSGRPFSLSIATAARGQFAAAYLHEPHGDPYRGENGLTAGFGPAAAEFDVDARNVVPGVYEAVAVSSPVQPLSAGFNLVQSPVTLRVSRRMDGALVEMENRTGAGVTAQPSLALVGGERETPIAGRGAEVSRLPLRIPAWASSVTVDVSMDRAQWSRFTDLGLTLYDSLGHQLAKAPLQYAFGRLTSELPSHHGDMRAELALYPGLAEVGSTERWSLDLSVRMYADSSAVVTTQAPPVSIAPGATGSVTIAPPTQPFHLDEGLTPLAVLMARIAGRIWTREVPLPMPGAVPNP